MAGTEYHLDPVALALDQVPARRERIERAFNELESRRVSLASFVIEWKQLEEHFMEVESSLRKRYEELGEREKSLNDRVRDVEESLSKRAEAISAREEASLARVQEQREAAIATIVEEKRRLHEERLHLDNGVATGASNMNTLENSASPEHATSEHIIMGNGAHQHSEESNESPMHGPGTGGNSSGTPTPPPAKLTVTAAAVEVRVRPELRLLCENMDGDGLRKYVTEHRKDVSALRVELPAAIQCAIDPARLVLDALEGYNLPSSEVGEGDRKECGASANRRACVLILESVVSALADPVLGPDHPVVPANIKERAKELADKWRSKMEILKETPGSENSLDAQAFLQLLATYGIASEFDDEELCRLVTSVARRRQSPALCRALGLARKIPDMVDRLSKEGKQVEALAFAHAFDIMDRVEPVPLLKAYLKEARKNAQLILKNGNNSAAAQNDSSMKELSALKSVLKCIEEYKLEPHFPPQSLQKRIDVLEKAKADRKRAAVAVKAQSKRPRPSNGNTVVYGNSGTGGGERNFYRSTDRAQFGGVSLSTYSLASQPGYDRRGQGGYTTTYAGNRNPVSYLYSAADGLSSSLYGSAAAYGNPSYSSYQFGSGLPPPPPAYQASFLH